MSRWTWLCLTNYNKRQHQFPLQNLATGVRDGETQQDSHSLDLLTLNMQQFQAIADQNLIIQTQGLIEQQLLELNNDYSFADLQSNSVFESVAIPQIGTQPINSDAEVNFDQHTSTDGHTHIDQIEGESTSESLPEEHVYACGMVVCRRRFKSLSSLLRHQSKCMYTESKTFTCTYDGCGQSYTNAYNLNYHMLTHRKERNFQCQHCLESFYTQQQLDVHSRSHTDHRPFVCGHGGCTSAFTTAWNLRSHRRTHTGDKPFVCEKCGNCFAEKSTLKKHYAVHFDAMRYTCDICSRQFTQTSSRLYHMRRQHPVHPS